MKKSNLIKIITLLMCFVLVAGVFSACGKKEETYVPETTEAPTETTTAGH